MDKYGIDFVDELPKYIQISRHIKKMIDKNIIEDGEKLPTIRGLSSILGVNKDTIISAYKKMETEGYAVKKMGSGTYAKRKDSGEKFKREYSKLIKKLSMKVSEEKYIDFAGDSTIIDYFPVEIFKEVINYVIDRDGASAFVNNESLGYKGLRKCISKNFWDDKIKSDDILIVSGAQQGIDIVSKALLNINDSVIVEKPTYGGALSVFKWRRNNIFEVDMEPDGVNVEQIEKILKKNKIKCFYTMSYFQNPSGISHSLEKKKKILSLAEKYDFFIIEDDYLSELIYSPEIKYNSFKSLDNNDRVMYIKSFSKIFLPGIRLGYVIPPRIYRENIVNSKVNTDISTSSLMQRALDLYISRGYWKEHISNMNNNYSVKYEYMKKCIEDNLKYYVDYVDPKGGMSFYLKIKYPIINSIELFYKCLEQNVLITPGILFYRNSMDGQSYFRMSFSKLDNNQICDGVNIIRDIFESIIG